MRQSSSQNQSPMSIAAHWVSVTSTISLEMALPGAFGYWLDGQWGTKPWLVIIGVVLGFVTGMLHLLQLVKTENQKEKDKTRDDNKGGR
jgi:F0F1-type ATP synthase assembly protein I